MDGIYRTNICGVDIAFYATGDDKSTDLIVENVRERIRNIMSEDTVAVPKAALLACLDAEEENSKLVTENIQLHTTVDTLTSEIRSLTISNAELEELLKQG